MSLLAIELLQPAMPPTGVLPPSAKPRMDWVQTVLPVGKAAEGFDVSPSGRELWTATPDGTLSVVDLQTSTVTGFEETGLGGALTVWPSPRTAGTSWS
ncbi:hypothetical protein LGR69_26350 [Methylobacterium brachiatum]|nr:hypothetical protein [Methylobacterium brachiatum]